MPLDWLIEARVLGRKRRQPVCVKQSAAAVFYRRWCRHRLDVANKNIGENLCVRTWVSCVAKCGASPDGARAFLPQQKRHRDADSSESKCIDQYINNRDCAIKLR